MLIISPYMLTLAVTTESAMVEYSVIPHFFCYRKEHLDLPSLRYIGELLLPYVIVANDAFPFKEKSSSHTHPGRSQKKKELLIIVYQEHVEFPKMLLVL